MLLAGIIIALCLYGFFAGLEAAYFSMNRFSVELKKKQGSYSGRILSEMKEKPLLFLGMAFTGMSLVLTAYGLLISRYVQSFWSRLPDFIQVPVFRLFLELIFSMLPLLFVYFFITSFFRAKSNQLLSLLARPVSVFSSVLSPISEWFTRMARWVLTYLFNVRVQDQKEQIGRIDLEQFLHQGRESGEETTELNAELFENALSFPKRKVRECLVPRKEIIGIDASSTPEEARNKFIETKLSRLVVFDGTIDQLVGYVHQLDLFRKPATLQEILLPIPAVPESMGATDLINRFTRERKSIAWVVDEFGGTSGIVTMEDLLEELFGEIKDEYDVEEYVEKELSDHEFIFSGRLELDYLKEKYRLVFEEDSESETLSGYIVEKHERIPASGEKIITGNYEFEMILVSETRIETVKVKLLR